MLATSCLVLFTSLGGTTYRWGSAPIIALGVAGAVLVGVFALVERRAVEPVLPLHLFKIRTFSVASIVGFIVGFAMFGAITYLPVFFQVVRGESPTVSGLQLLPLIVGMLTVSIASGQFISRTGRYRMFPIAGTALITVGLLMLSQLGIETTWPMAALYMLVLGMGLGAVMQVLVLIVQNAVPYSELGVATSGATFFRSIGGSFGAAIFGAIFANVLVGNLVRHLGNAKLPAGLSQLERHARHLGQTPRRGPSRPGRRLRRIDPDRVPHRRAYRLHRLSRLMAHPRTRTRRSIGTNPGARPKRTPRSPARSLQHRIRPPHSSPEPSQPHSHSPQCRLDEGEPTNRFEARPS